MCTASQTKRSGVHNNFPENSTFARHSAKPQKNLFQANVCCSIPAKA